MPHGFPAARKIVQGCDAALFTKPGEVGARGPPAHARAVAEFAMCAGEELQVASGIGRDGTEGIAVGHGAMVDVPLTMVPSSPPRSPADS